MRVARKLIAALLLGILAVLAVHAYLRVQREVSLFETDMERDGSATTRVLAAAVTEVWRTDGPARAAKLVEDLGAREKDREIRWVWLDAPEGDPAASWLPRSALEPASRGKRVFGRVHRNGDDYLVSARPVMIADQRPGAVEVAESFKGQRQYVTATLLNQLAATASLLIVCAGLTIGLGALFVGGPLRRLTAQARLVGSGDLTARLHIKQNDEIGELAQEMNAMCDRLLAAHDRIASEMTARISALEHLRHADRLATVGKLASGIAHELGAPLQVVSGRARMIADGDLTAAEVGENARIIHEQSDRMAKIIRQLLDFARQRSASKARMEMGPMLRKTANLLAPLAEKSNVVLLVEDAPQPIEALLDADQILQVLMNLVVNGIHAMPRGGELTMAVRRERIQPPEDHGGPEGWYARLIVEDHGEGMRQSVMDHVFEPFFTTKPVGEGTGLGLAVAWGIVREHGGWIHVKSVVGKGSVFSVYFPLGEAS